MLRNKIFCSVLLMLTVSVSAQKVGLVLSGGGAKGITHLGVIKALEDDNVPIDYIAGTSMGAIVGSMYAMGHTADEIIEILKSEDFRRWSTGELDPKYTYYYRNSDPKPTIAEIKFNIRNLDSLSLKPKFLPTNIIPALQMNYAFVELYSRVNALSKENFDSLFVPFRCVASDIYRKEAVVFKNGNLGDAVRASMSFPFMFKPLVINKRLLFDGGIYNNFPVNVMRDEFRPDIMIGSVVSNNPPEPDVNDILEQIANMIVNKSDYTLPESEGILLSFDLENVKTFDFKKVDELVQFGYDEAIKKMPEIKARINRETSADELYKRRMAFRKRLPELQFKNVIITGIDSLQKHYVENIIHQGNKKFSNQEFKEGYFKLVSDDKISEVMPHAEYNDSTKCFDLRLHVRTEDQLKLMVGGNISSATTNVAYFGLSYQNLRDYAQTAYVDAMFGKAYNGISLGTRIDVPTAKNWYMKVAFALHRFDYYAKQSAFYNDDRTSNFNQSEVYGKFSIGFPVTMRGRIEFGLGYGGLRDNYRQNLSLTTTGLDESIYQLGSMFSKFETNTLNNILYPTSGEKYSVGIQLIGGESSFKSRVDPDQYNTNKKDLWFQFKGATDKYFRINKSFILGGFSELVVSNRKSLNNYTSTVIQMPAFRPTPHSKVIFNEAFSANQFLALGIKPIYTINEVAHLRTEAYFFIPYQQAYRNWDNKVAFKQPFSTMNFMTESSLIFNFKFVSAGLFVNYYSSGVSKWNIGINIGYLLFNNRFLD